MDDPLFLAQTERLLGAVTYGGADPDEVAATVARLTSVDLDLWHREWTATAERAFEAGAYLRASSYFRTSWLFLLDAPIDPRLVEAHRREVDAFRRGIAELPVPATVVEIPYENGVTLPGYWIRPADDEVARPTMILTTGYDGTSEELWFSCGAAALARGYNVLAFDGPGQGTMIIERGSVLRPDWENVVTPVVDFVLGLPGVDPSRLVLSGLSLGGYLAPRAATAEHRLAAVVSDCGPYDVLDTISSRLPGFLARSLPEGSWLLRRVLAVVSRKPTAGWALRRARLVHGVAEPLDYFRVASQFSLVGREHLIACPTFVCSAEKDDLSAGAPALYDALFCPKEYVQFTVEEGAGEHCEGAARPLVNARVLAWLDGVLTPAAQVSAAGA